MSLTERWLEQLKTLCENNETTLITGNEFQSMLSQLVSEPRSPYLGIDFHLNPAPPFDTLTLGVPSDGDPTDIRTITPFDNHGSSCRVRVWRKSEVILSAEETASTNALLDRLVRSYWRGDLRDEKRLFSIQNPVTANLSDRTVERYMKGVGRLCAFFCDLDHFKAINDALGMAEGDRVLLALASIVSKHALPKAIPLRRSGDEFILLYPDATADEALILAIELMEAVADYDFGLSNFEVRLAAGISVLENESISYKELEERAEKAIKVGGEITKLRGVIRLRTRPPIESPTLSQISRETGLCIVKSCVGSERPFESPWLNMVSNYVSTGILERNWQPQDLKKHVDRLLAGVKPTLDQSILRASLTSNEKSDFEPTFSSYDLLLAVAHGFLRSAFVSRQKFPEKSLAIQHETWSENCCLQLMPDDITIASFGTSDSALESWELGGFISYSDDTTSIPQDTRRALLIKIGHAKLSLPEAIFADVIVVDDRPTRGGGLPDFWEATVARVISRINIDSNIAAVYIFGPREYGVQTISKFTNLDLWATQAEEMNYKTGMSFQSISTAANRLSNRVVIPDSDAELIDSLATLLRPNYDVVPLAEVTNFEHPYRFLQRDTELDSMALGRDDGCRLETIAQAFPVVLDIARRTALHEIVDQAGQTLKELVDFKVCLTNPSKDAVPAFYWNEESLLAEYFDREFLSSNGLFGAAFAKDGQLGAVMDHVASSILGPKQFSTRRAVLVVPHHTRSNEDITPLGLISVRIVPRISPNRTILHYSYTWRTVEALVGFPYSLYGSVKFGQHLTEEIRKRLNGDAARKLEMGEVSYIAHSLHIFLDEYGQSIARRIVDNASF